MIDIIVSGALGGLAGFIAARALGIGWAAWLLGGIFALAIYVSLGG